MKKIFVLALMICISVCVVFTLNACEQEDFATEGLMFELNGGSYGVSGYNGTEKNVVIPTNYDGKPVTSIKYQAFYNCDLITSITIPSSIVSIGESAFYGCNDLQIVYISSIEDWSNISYGDDYSCPLRLAKKLYLIGSETPITDLVIPEGVTSIPEYGFSSISIKSIVIPSTVTSIGNHAFDGCAELSQIEYNASKIKDSILMDNYIFYDAGQKGNGMLTIGNTVQEIPDYLFVGTFTFNGTKYPKIKSVEFEQGSICTSIGTGAFGLCQSLTSVNLPDSLTSIGNSAFSNCAIMKITLPESLIYIKDGAFSSCTALTKIIIPNSVTSIGVKAFDSCESLATVVIGNGVTSIGNQAFYNCSSLTNITIPNSVSYIGFQAFRLCSNLSRVIFQEPNGWWYSKNATATSGNSLLVSDLTNASTAANYLVDYSYYWKRG